MVIILNNSIWYLVFGITWGFGGLAFCVHSKQLWWSGRPEIGAPGIGFGLEKILDRSECW